MNRETETIEQQMKKLLKEAVADLSAFEKLTISQPAVHYRLLSEDHDVFLDPKYSLTRQTVQTLEALTMSRFVASIDAGGQSLPQSQECILLWNTYFERAPTSRDVPSVPEVLRYCRDKIALEEIFTRAQKFVSQSRRYDHKTRERLLTLLSSEETIESVAASFVGSERTFRNRLNRAIRELASEIQRKAPKAFEPAEAPGHLSPVLDLQPVQDYILSEIKDHRNELDFLTTCHVESPIEIHPIRGDPIPPGTLEDAGAFSPGLLAGLPGSGRTTCLKRIAYLSVAERTLDHNTSFAFYLRARDFLPYAKVPERSIYNFIADKVFANASDALEAKIRLCKWLAKHDEDGKLRLLVDDLDRLPVVDQKQIVARLAFSNVVFATLPWQVDEIIELMQQPVLGKFVLSDLDPEQQRQMLAKLAREYPDQDIDLDLALFALDEMPDLAKFPLGIMTIYTQVVEHHSERTLVARRVLENLLESAGVTLSPLENDWHALNETTRSMIHAATNVVYNLNGRSTLSKNPASIGRVRYEATAESGWGCTWSKLISTRLFEPSEGQEVMRFVNEDIMCYCAAMAISRGNVFLDAAAESHPGTAQLARRVRAYQNTLWEGGFVSPD